MRQKAKLNLPAAIHRHQELIQHLKGRVFDTIHSGKIIVLEYKDSNNILIKFLNTGNCRTARLSNLYRGQIQDKESVGKLGLIFGVGFLGSGQYTKSNSKKAYNVWYSMLMRCYDSKEQEENPSYKDCVVCSEWYNFQNFASWHLEHSKCNDAQIDKDVRIKGNKVYSPDTCCMLPAYINKIFVKRKSCRGNTPIGVEYESKRKTYVARLRNKIGWPSYLGSYDTPEKAFAAYKNGKEKYIKHMASIYANHMDEIAYNALMNYQIEISD